MLQAPNPRLRTAGIIWILSIAVSAINTAKAESTHIDHTPLPVDEALTLTAAVDAALASYPMTVELGARSEQADAWVDRGRSWIADRPSLLLRYQSDRWGPDNGLQEFEAGILLPLWNWGGRSAVRDLGEAMSSESSSAGLALRWEVAGLLRSAIWNIALAENNRDLATQALDNSTRLTRSVERRHELGDVALSDVLLAQSSYLEAQTALIETTATLLDVERTYRAITGLEGRPPFSGEILSQSREIEADHPVMVFANAEVNRAEASLAVAQKTARSGASLLIGHQSERPAFGDEFADSIGIAVSIPFGGSSHRRAEITVAARTAASATARRNQQLRTLTLALHESAHSLDVVRENSDRCQGTNGPRRATSGHGRKRLRKGRNRTHRFAEGAIQCNRRQATGDAHAN